MGDIVVKERDIVDGKWVASEKKLDDASPDAVMFKQIVLQCEDGSKQVTLKLDDDGVLKLIDGANEFRVLVTGINSQSGEVIFNNTKSMRVDFPKEFRNWPAITLTMVDDNNTPPYRIWPGKTGFTVRFKNKFTGSVSWVAVEA